MDRTTMDRPVAIKVLFDGADEARFHREALLLANCAIRHRWLRRHLAPMQASVLAMQWLSGIDLAERLRHGGAQPKKSRCC